MRKGILHILTLLLLAMLAGCSDFDLFSDGARPGTITLCLGAGDATRADIPGSPDDLSPATPDERAISDLRYFIFPTDGNGAPLKGYLIPPTPEESAGEQYKTYTIEDVEPGSYRVYVVANMPDCAGVTSEAGLRDIVLSYSSETLPEPGNLPMVYEPMAETIVGAGGAIVTANLQFTCVKVRYNILFTEKSREAFGRSGLMITSVGAHRLSSSAPLVLGGYMDTAGTADTFDAPLAPGRFYSAWNRDDNAPGDADVITPLPADGAPESFTSDWLYQGTLYLPERYVSDDEEQTELTIEGIIVDSSVRPGQDGTPPATVPVGSVASYTLSLGHSNGEGQPRQFPRGTYYEIIAEVVSRDVTELEAEVRISDWIPVFTGDFGHTTLKVDKTRAVVNSLETDSIHYQSNSPYVEMGCDLTVDGEPLIVLSDHDPVNKVISFGMNPAIPIERFSEGGQYPPTGETKIWIQAGNIRKYLPVEYEVEPLFEVTPLAASVSRLEGVASSPTYTKTFSYRTNLGGISGISFPSEMTVSGSVIRIECPDPHAAIGTFTVTSLTQPPFTTDHTFTVAPMNSAYASMAREICVTVKPPFGKYRVNFRVINDNQGDQNNSPNLCLFDNYANTDPEGAASNWSALNWGATGMTRCIYAYTQYGETVGNDIPKYYVWVFTQPWEGTTSGDNMGRDTSNPGWYYAEFDSDQTAVNSFDGSRRTIKPGETLLMFNAGVGDRTRHRCPHHLDPGIQLFDYEDREGWIVYDPLCDPYYKIYDDRPVMEDVTYTIISTKPVMQWYINYGHAGNSSASETFTLGQTSLPTYTATDATGRTWYVTYFYAKAPAGDYAKSINVLFSDYTSSRLFGGNGFRTAPGAATGYYADGKWTQGTPKGLTLRPQAQRRYVYIKVPAGWNAPRLYMWNDATGLNNGAWPGKSMARYNDDGWFYIAAPTEYNYIIVNEDNKAQSADTNIGTSGGDLYFEYDGTHNGKLTPTSKP